MDLQCYAIDIYDTDTELNVHGMGDKMSSWMAHEPGASVNESEDDLHAMLHTQENWLKALHQNLQVYNHDVSTQSASDQRDMVSCMRGEPRKMHHRS